MPISIQTTTGATTYVSPFVQLFATAQIKIDASVLTAREVDDKGNLKPGVPFNIDVSPSVLPTAAGQQVGVVHEAVNLGASLAAVQAITNDPQVAVGVIGTLNHDIAEDNLGAALTAGEIAALKASQIVFLT